MYLKVPEGDKRVTGEPVLEKILAENCSEMMKDLNPHIPESKKKKNCYGPNVCVLQNSYAET